LNKMGIERFSYKYKVEYQINLAISESKINSLNFDLRYLNSGMGRECTYGIKSHYDVVNFRNSWRRKTGADIQGKYNPGDEGEFESKSLDWMRCEAYLAGIEIGECIESNTELGELNVLLFPPSRSLGKKAVIQNNHLGSIVCLGAYNHLKLLGFNLEIISNLSCSDYIYGLFQSAESLIFIDETIMSGKTLGRTVSDLAKICANLDVNIPPFSVYTDFRKSSTPIKHNFPNRTGYGFKKRVTRDQHPAEPNWFEINDHMINLLENHEE